MRTYTDHEDIIYEYSTEETKKHKPSTDYSDLTIKVRYHADIDPIKKTEKGDWIDLRAAEDIELKAGESTTLSLGVSIKLPDGYEAYVVPRSSTFKNWSIIQTNHMGIIDNSYCGDNDIWKMPVYAMRDTKIRKNDRICQFRIQQKQPEFRIETVDRLDDEDRGGFGSSGIN